MRIFNGTKSQMSLPYVGGQRINIDPMSVSGNVGPTDELVALIVTAYTSQEVALIVSGPYELATTSRNPVAVDYVVQTVDEAIQKLAVKKEEEPKKEEAPKVEAPKTEGEVKPEEAMPVKRGRGRPRKNPAPEA